MYDKAASRYREHTVSFCSGRVPKYKILSFVRAEENGSDTGAVIIVDATYLHLKRGGN
jgi:hypothetical protein